MDPWFGPKDRYDGGIASWQGGLATLIFFGTFFFFSWFFRPADLGWPEWSRVALMLAVGTGYGVLVWARYDHEPL